MEENTTRLSTLTKEKLEEKAFELYPNETPLTCKDKFAREMRNEILQMVRAAFVSGAQYAAVEFYNQLANDLGWEKL